MDSNEKQQGRVNFEVIADDETAHGIYSNLAGVAHTETEFVFDFLFLQPSSGKAKLRARVILSPQHAKRFIKVVSDNLSKYETRWGKISEAVNSNGSLPSARG